MEYKFVSENAGHKLEDVVNSLIGEGWIPLGGISVSGVFSSWENVRKSYPESETEWVYAQAMTRTAEQAKVAAAAREC